MCRKILILSTNAATLPRNCRLLISQWKRRLVVTYTWFHYAPRRGNWAPKLCFYWMMAVMWPVYIIYVYTIACQQLTDMSSYVLFKKTGTIQGHASSVRTAKAVRLLRQPELLPGMSPILVDTPVAGARLFILSYASYYNCLVYISASCL